MNPSEARELAAALIECADFIAHFSDDPDIHTVICYMEGVQNGRKFLDAANKARRAGKKVVVVKAGDNPEKADYEQRPTANPINEEKRDQCCQHVEHCNRHTGRVEEAEVQYFGQLTHVGRAVVDHRVDSHELLHKEQPDTDEKRAATGQ